MHIVGNGCGDTHIHIAVLVETRESLERGLDVLCRDVPYLLRLENAD